MSFIYTAFVMLMLCGACLVLATAFAAKKATQHPEAAGGIAKFLLGLFKK